MSNFRIGQKVVCIKNGSPNCLGFSVVGAYPVYGAIYTVRGTYVGPEWTQIYLAELPKADRHHPDGCEVGWKASNFRAIVSKTLSEDIALFKAISEDSLGRLEVLEEELNR